LSETDLPGALTNVLNVRRIKRIDHHPAEPDDDSAPDSISDTDNWHNWHDDLDNPNDIKEACEADDESDIDPNNGIKASESPEHWVVSAAPNVPGLIWPTRRSVKDAEKGLMTVRAMETRRNKGNKKKKDRLGQDVFTRFYMLLD